MANIDSKLLARQIDAYLASNGIPKSEFVERTGISSATLSQWRNGKYAPSDRSIAAIEDYTNMPIEALLGGRPSTSFTSPSTTDEFVSFPVMADVAAGYDHIAYQDWTGDSIDIPRSWLRGRPATDYFVIRVKGDSMYPDYQDGDHVVVLSQSTMDRSGQVGVVRYNDETATLKRIEYVMGEDWMTLRPINPQFPPVTIRDAELEECTVFGVAKYVIRELNQ
jgi:repressor LexA